MYETPPENIFYIVSQGAACVQRSRAVGKAHTGHRNRIPGTK